MAGVSVAELTNRQYSVRLGTAMVVYAGLLVGSLVLINGGIEEPWRAIAAFVPALPMLYVVLIVIGRFRGLDEYWQRIQIEALPFAFLGTIVVVFTWGFAEIAGFERPSGFVVFFILNGLYVVGLLLARRRYS